MRSSHSKSGYVLLGSVLLVASFLIPINRVTSLFASHTVVCDSINFAEAVNFKVGADPRPITIGDFNGDRKQDLAVVNTGSEDISVLLGNGTGSFDDAINFELGTLSPFIIASDFNGDGKQDLVTTNLTTNNISVLLGNGAGGFGAATNFEVGTFPGFVAIGDFNDDGQQDLVTTNALSNNISILIGDGTGSFAMVTNFDLAASPGYVAVGDFNADGKQDLAIINNQFISILFGNGAGSFGVATNFAAGPNPTSIAIGDFNGDSNQDLATANYASNTISILLGNGLGEFGTPTNFEVEMQPLAIIVGDFNGDGKQDLVTTNYGSDSISILAGDGFGSFAKAMNFAVGKIPLYVTLGDFNGDSRQDLATANLVSGDVSILINTCNTVPTVTVEQAALQSDPTNASTINFIATFSEPINASSFTNTDVTLGGTAGATTPVITEVAPNDGTTFNIAVSGMTGSGTVMVFIPANNIQDLDGNGNITSGSIDNTVMYDVIFPTVLSTSLQAAYNTTGPNSLTVIFSENVNNADGGGNADDVTSLANYLLVETGLNGIFNTVSCAHGLVTDDTQVIVNNVTYNPDTFTSTITINGSTALPAGSYRLFVCGTTSIVDLALNPLNNGTDYIFNFTVDAPPVSNNGAQSSTSPLPDTGFTPNRITSLAPQTASLAYATLGDIWLEIPKLNIKSSIVGVPQSSAGNWNIDWLGSSTGWLNGTAFPSWKGNSVLTAHVTDANGLPGPFVNIKNLKYGDQIIVYLGGQKYIFEVRASRFVSPADTTYAYEHLEDHSYLTLITCQGYDEKSDSYRYRRIVRAVLVDVQDE